MQLSSDSRPATGVFYSEHPADRTCFALAVCGYVGLLAATAYLATPPTDSTADASLAGEISALPAEVAATLRAAEREYGRPMEGATWTNFVRMSSTNHPIYRIRGTNGRGHEIEIEITAPGRIVEVEEWNLAIDELPAPVVAAAKSMSLRLDQARIRAVFGIGGGAPVCYVFSAYGNTVETGLAADGKLLWPAQNAPEVHRDQ